jgi:hypothetical protein
MGDIARCAGAVFGHRERWPNEAFRWETFCTADRQSTPLRAPIEIVRFELNFLAEATVSPGASRRI